MLFANGLPLHVGGGDLACFFAQHQGCGARVSCTHSVAGVGPSEDTATITACVEFGSVEQGRLVWGLVPQVELTGPS